MTESAEPHQPRHRRSLTVVIVALTLVVVAIVGGVLWWNGRGPTKPSIGGAVDRFRSSATASGPAIALRPDPGVYIYAGTGSEHLSFLSTSQSQNGDLPGTVTRGADGCWSFVIDYNSFHRQTSDRCSRGGRLVERGGATDQKFDFGALSQSEHTETVCDPPTTLYDPEWTPGHRAPVRCRGHSQTTKADMVQRGHVTFVGRTTVVVDGTRVPAIHYAQDFKITGDQSGSQHEDAWIAASSGLPLREARSINVVSPAPAPLNQVTYTERGGWRLTSLTPRT